MSDPRFPATTYHEHLQLALNATGHGIWELDCGTGRMTWDEQLLRIHGLGRGELKGLRQDWERQIHPDDRPGVGARFAEFLASERSNLSLNFRIVRPDGAVRTIATNAYVRRDQKSEALAMIGFDLDTTEANDLREHLRVAEERWRLAVESSNDAVWDWNLVTKEVFRDERFTDMLGYDPAEMYFGERIWRSLGHPDDVGRIEAAVEDCLAGRAPQFQCEFRLRHRAGRWVWALGRGKVVSRDPAGRPLRMVGTLSDITARKQLDERLRHSEELSIEISRLAQIGAWEWNVASGRLTWSPEMFRIHEVDLGYEPTLAKALGFFPAAAQHTLQEAINFTVHSGTGFDFELPFRSALDRALVVRVQGKAEVEHGRTVRVYGAYHDVTERRGAEDTRRKLESQLFQAQKMETLGTLAGGIAHDFNNLLTGILGYQELALESLAENDPARATLAAAKEASLRARELVDQILTFSRQSASEKVPVSLAQLVEDARRFLRATVPTTISILVDMEPGCGDIVADATQIHQVLLNLGSNAAHAMRAKGGAIRLKLAPVELDGTGEPPLASLLPGRYLRLDFSDQGHGMDEATKKRIFDPFFTTKEVGQGTGLGLSVVHGIIQAHNGAITVASTPDAGATFTIYLPAAEEPVATAQEDGSAPPQGHGELVAVLDDDATICRIVQLALTKSGYRVEIFNSPTECLEAMRRRSGEYVLLLTDQTMPVLKGTELASEVRAFAPQLPILIMSGYFSRISPEKLKLLGRVSLIPKPFTNAELVWAIDRALR